MQFEEVRRGYGGYPPLLLETTNPPERIFVRGKLPDAGVPHIAIVGTRKATREGRELAKKTAKALAGRGFIIVSGLAMGIDTAAHTGALEAGGLTVAVLGTGIDKVYPAQNENLANRIILSGGAIMSEYASGTPSYQSNFLERNRIVAGLCAATVVIEAPARSGAIVTARLAAEYGREVFVFPGPAGHPQWAGSHALIRDGARLVHSTDDILEDLASNIEKLEDSGDLFSEHSAVPTGLVSDKVRAVGTRAKKIFPQEKNYSVSEKRSHEAEKVLRALTESKIPLSVDKIIEITKLTAQEANQALGELVICGIVEETATGYKLKM